MTNREMKLALVLPAVAVLGGFGYFFLAPKLREVKAAQGQLDQLKSKGTSSVGLVDDRARLVVLNREIATESHAIESLRKRWDVVVRSSTSQKLGRPERITRLHQLLDRAGLHVIDESDGDANMSGVPPSLDVLAKEIGDSVGQPPPRVRVVRFTGRYADVAAAMRALAGADILAIPLGLTMKPIVDDPDTLEWSLQVWV